jgi:hypothetical protein
VEPLLSCLNLVHARLADSATTWLTPWRHFNLAGCASGAAHLPHPAPPSGRAHARRDPSTSYTTLAHAEHCIWHMTARGPHITSRAHLMPSPAPPWQDSARYFSSYAFVLAPFRTFSLRPIRSAHQFAAQRTLRTRYSR